MPKKRTILCELHCKKIYISEVGERFSCIPIQEGMYIYYQKEDCVCVLNFIWIFDHFYSIFSAKGKYRVSIQIYI